jgi:tape measure domain-containing protein
MSGVIIDVESRAESAKRDLAAINRSLVTLVNNSKDSSKALSQLSTVSTKPLTASVQATTKSLGKMRQVSASAFTTTVKGSKSAVSSLFTLRKTAILLGSTLAGIASVGVFHRMADDVTEVRNKLTAIIQDHDELFRKQRQLYDLSRETLANWKSTTQTFVDFNQSLSRSTNLTQKEIMGVIRTLNQANALAGESASAIDAAMLQLNQGIASGTLRGEELNSVLKQSKYLGMSIMKHLNLDAHSLRQFAAEGRLTTQLIVDVLQKMAKETDEVFSRTAITASMAVAQTRQAMGYYISDINSYLGVTDRFVRRIRSVGDYLSESSTDVVANLIVLRGQFRKYFTFLDDMSEEEATVQMSLDFDLTPIDAAKRYALLKKVKGYYDSVRSIFVQDRTEIEVTMDLETPLDRFRRVVLGVKRSESALRMFIETRGTLKKVYDFSQSILEALEVSAGGLRDMLPNVRVYLRSYGDMAKKASLKKFLEIDTARFRALDAYTRKVRRLTEMLTLHRTGDTRLENAWIDLFQSAGVNEFIGNLRELNKLRKSWKRDDFSFIGKQMFQDFRRGTFWIDDFLIRIGLMESRLISVRQTRFDRLIRQFDYLRSSMEAVYKSVLVPTLRPVLIPMLYSVYLTVERVVKEIEHILQPIHGLRLGRAFAEALIRGFNFLVNLGKSIVESIKSSLRGEGDVNTITSVVGGYVMRVMKAVIAFYGSFLLGFAKRMWEELGPAVEALFDGLERIVKEKLETLHRVPSRIRSALSERLRPLNVFAFLKFEGGVLGDFLDSIKKTFKKVWELSKDLLGRALDAVYDFTSKVKIAFYGVYDKVVGRSYWPDMIDGVLKHTDRLRSGKERVLSYTDFVKNAFREAFEFVGRQLSTFAGFGDLVIDKFVITVKSIDVGGFLAAFRDEIAKLIITITALVFGNWKLKVVALGYITSIFNVALDRAMETFQPAIAKLMAWMITDLAFSLVRGFVSTFNTLIQALPEILRRFKYEMVPGFLHPILNLISPLTAFLRHVTFIGSDLLLSLTAIATVFALLNKHARAFVMTLAFGAKLTKKNVAVRSGGIMDWLGGIAGRTGWASHARTADSFMSRIFSQRHMALAGAGILSAAMLESVTLTQAAISSLPFFTFAVFGREGSQRVIAEIINWQGRIITGVLSDVGRTHLEVGRWLWNSFFPPKFPPAVVASGVNNVVSSVKTARVALFAGVRKSWGNMLKNQDMFGRGAISFSDMFLNTYDTKGNVVGRLDLGERVKDYFRALGRIKVGTSTLGAELTAMTNSVNSGLKKFFAFLLDLPKHLSKAWRAFHAFVSGWTKTAKLFMLSLLAIAALGVLFSPKTAEASSFKATSIAAEGTNEALAVTIKLLMGVGGAFAVLATAFFAFNSASMAVFSQINRAVQTFVGLLKAAWAIIQTITLATWELLKPLLLIGAKFSLVFGGVGALGLWLFGPGNTFFENLQWAWDKVRGIAGAENEVTAGGRRVAMRKLLGGDMSFGGVKADFTDMVGNLNFQEMSEKQFRVLKDVAKTTKDGLRRLEDAYTAEGTLTRAQIEGGNKLVADFNRIAVRMPAYDANSLQGLRDAMQSELNSFQTGFLDELRRMRFGEPSTKPPKVEESFMDVAPTQAELDRHSGWWKDVFSRMLRATAPDPGLMQTMLSDVEMEISEARRKKLRSLIWGGTQPASRTDLSAQIDWGFDLAAFYEDVLTDSASQKIRDDFLDAARVLRPFANLLMDRETAGDLSRFFQGLRKGYAGDRRISAKTSDAELEKIFMADLEVALEAFNNRAKEMLTRGEFKFAVESTRRRFQDLADTARDFLGLDFGQHGVEFAANNKQLREMEDIVREVAKLMEVDGAFEMSPDADSRRSVLLQRASARRQAQLLQEAVTADTFFDTALEVRVKLLDDRVPSDIIAQALDDPLTGGSLGVQFEQLRRLESQLKSTTVDRGVNSIRKLRIEIAELRNEILRGLPGSTFLDDINAKLSAAGLDQMSGDRWSYANAPALQAMDEALRNYEIKRNEFMILQEDARRSFFPEWYAKDLQDKQRELSDIKESIQAMFDGVQADALLGLLEEAETLEELVTGFRRITGEGIPGHLFSDAEKFNRYLATTIRLKFLESQGDRGTRDEIVRRNEEIEELRSTLNNLQSTSTFTFDSMIGKLRETGLELSNLAFSGMDAGLQNMLHGLSSALEDIDKELGQEKASGLLGDRLSSLMDRRADLLKEMADKLVSVLHATNSNVNSAFERIGVTGAEFIASASDATLNRVLLLDKKLQSLRVRMENTKFDASNIDEWRKLVVEMAQAELDSKRLAEDAMENFTSRAGKINEMLGISLDEAALVSLNETLFNTLYATSKDLGRALEDAIREGSVEGIRSAFAKMRDFKSHGDAVSFLVSLADAVSDALKKGARDAFESLSRSGEFAISFRDFMAMPLDTRQKLTVVDDLLAQYESAMNRSDLTDGLVAILYEGLLSGDLEGGLERFKKEYERQVELGLNVGGATNLHRLHSAYELARGGAAVQQEAALEDLGRMYSTLEYHLQKIHFKGDFTTLNLMSGTQMDRVVELARNINEAGRILALAQDRNDTNAVRRLQTAIDAWEYELSRIPEAVTRQREALREARKLLQDSVSSSLEGAMSDLLKGKREENKSYFRTFLEAVVDDFTSTVVDVFVKGLLSPITAEDGILMRWIGQLGENIWRLGARKKEEDQEEVLTEMRHTFAMEAHTIALENAARLAEKDLWDLPGGDTDRDEFGDVSKMKALTKEEPIKAVGEDIVNGVDNQLVAQEGFFTSLGRIFTSGFNLLGGLFSGLIGSLGAVGGGALNLLNVLFMNRGGFVYGSGSGVRDTIPAMLAPGEFVVNASAVRKWAPLLFAINSGKVRGFSSGGLVTSPSSVPISTDRSVSSHGGGQTVVNINITGDISRQTRSEIYKMLPSIATGVNMQNKERGHR